MGVKLVRRDKMRSAAAPKPLAAGAAVVDFILQDNGDDTCTVYGVDQAGNRADISAVATLTPAPASSDPSVVAVDPPSGMTFKIHAVGPTSTPGSPVNITVTATWNDGSKGPFSFTLPVDVVAGPVTGVIIVPGTPTQH